MSSRAATVVAFGGNAMMRAGQAGTPAEQIANARAACGPLVERVARGDRLVLVHGNGPQVGVELAATGATLDVCVAATQGTMGYFLELALRDALRARGVEARIATLATLVRVERDDPAFAAPDKPVGPVGARRLVASPAPREVLDLGAIAALIDAGYLVIAGGGGIPVVRGPGGDLAGVEAVIDKDRTAALIGAALGARELFDLTAIDVVYREFGTARATPLPRLTVDEARRLLAEGQFPPGSMGPKVEAACAFLDAGGDSVLITAMDTLDAALRGDTGTRIDRRRT